MRFKTLTIGLVVTASLITGCSRGRLTTETSIGSETIPVIMPTGDAVTHPKYGKETFLAVGALSGIKPISANGVADMHVFEQGTTLATIKLNIAIAPQGFRYAAWLTKPGSGEKTPLGILDNPLGDVRYAVSATVEKDLRNYTEVSVTLERVSGPSDTDIPQAEGILKTRIRN